MGHEVCNNTDLISGNVRQVHYNWGRPDQFHHRYEYDADNRITAAYTSRDGEHYERDAEYEYYLHGPLMRIVVGDDKLQGIDYVYTIQGWLKGINHPSTDVNADPGNDGNQDPAEEYRTVEDGFGMILNYYAGDFTNAQSSYNSIGTGGMWQSMSVAAQPKSLKHLYNGNISAWELKTNGMIDNTGQALQQHGNAYEYDVLNRIKTYQEYENIGSNWHENLMSYSAEYSYDPNGNLMTLQRQSQGGATIDSFTYQYQPSTNKLITLTDAIGATPETNDIEGAHSYTYDESGNLTSDIAEDIQNIDWTLDGKFGNVQKTNESIEFAYDATGNRVLKSYDNGTTVTNTYYIRDASGLIMATYTNETEGNPPGGGEPLVAGLLPSDIKVKEWPMYGSGAQSRIGTREGRATSYTIDQPVKDLPVFTEILGQKNYEISDHLGNVRLTFRDVRVTGDKLHLTSGVDYYPFGMQKEAETYNQSGYSFGFNGMEKDDEVKGEGNSLDFGARIYDPRVGRWMSRDAMEGKYASFSPYMFVESNPVKYVDPDGNDAAVKIDGNKITISTTIFIYGSGATEAVAKEMQKNINKAWARDASGNYWTYKDPETGKVYQVELDVKVTLYNKDDPSDSPGLFSGKNNPFNTDNYIEVSKESKRSFVRGGDEGVWRSKGRGNKKLSQDDSAPHEFGHILGLPDQYTDQGPNPGWAGNIMAEPAMKGVVEQKNIDEFVAPLIVEYNEQDLNSGETYETKIDP